jgi:glutamate-ammonia-ligase adenylyltransferase
MTDVTRVQAGIDALPAELQSAVRERWARFVEERPEQAAAVAGNERVAGSLPRVWACSEYVATACLRYPEDLDFLLGDSGADAPWTAGSLDASDPEEDEAVLMRRLRIFRRRETLRVAWRDLAGWSTLDESLGHLSELACVCIRAAVNGAHRRLSQRFGEPLDREGRPQRLLVLGMGKLGGGELNFSSDIDLVFLFPSAGDTAGPRATTNDQFFTRLGQAVIRILDQATADGFVYRVDMRLRPFGDSGPLCVSLSAFEDYLQQHGRAWERYAYVKARPVTGHAEGMGLYADILRPFVFRRYLDYGVFESLRRMKHRIEAEGQQGAARDDIKRGAGGIREIEFVTQCFQILQGGARAELRVPALLDALSRLVGQRQLAPQVVDDLTAAYRFLRRVENRLQAWRDEQTHVLPSDELGRLRLAYAMDFPDWPSFLAELDRHRERVQACFREHVIGELGARGDGEPAAGFDLWGERMDAAACAPLMAAARFPDPDRALELIRRLRGQSFVRRLDARGRERLGLLVPAAVAAAAGSRRPGLVLERLLEIVAAVGLRSSYLALLIENRAALDRLAQVCDTSAFLARQVAEHPLLLDELIDPRIFESPPTQPELAAGLRERLAGIPEQDLDAQMDALRRFQRGAVFLVAVADLSGALPIMKVSDHLTAIAEVVLDASVTLARRHLEHRHGVPRCGAGEARRRVGFAVIGYGKLGGLELGYGSDLDLVFMHDSTGDNQSTDGARPLDNGVFFARLARRLGHLLSTPTTSGVLYEVDTRLRPSGKGGLLVTSLHAFEAYQRTEAWTWEHQALLRARAVAGDPAVRAHFEDVRRKALTGYVRRDGLRCEVANMRDRMRRELVDGGPDSFDIKQARGGIADIEFLVQYLVLAGAHECPALIEYSDNIRQLEALVAAGRLAEDDAGLLRQAYLAYRDRLHRLALDGRPGLVPRDELTQFREAVAALWQRIMVDEPGG